MARPGDPFTDEAGDVFYTDYLNECSDIHSLARSMFKGETNLTEWYFSVRRLIDFLAAVADYGPLYGLNTFYQRSALENMPVIEFLAEEGVITNDILRDGLPVNPVILEGLNHMDPMFMSANTSSRRPNEIIQPLIDFAKNTIQN